MRKTTNLDKALLEEALGLIGAKDRTALIQRESARRLAALEGAEPDIRPVRRRVALNTSD